MKLVTSTGDFTGYVHSIAEEIKSFRDSKFRYINLEQVDDSFLMDDEKLWRSRVDDWGEAAAWAGITFAASHSPCVSPFGKMTEENYQVCLRAIRRNLPFHRQPWEHQGQTVSKLLNPSIDLKKQAIDLLYETGKYILQAYDCYEI